MMLLLAALTPSETRCRCIEGTRGALVPGRVQRAERVFFGTVIGYDTLPRMTRSMPTREVTLTPIVARLRVHESGRVL